MEEAGKELKTKAIFNRERQFIFEMAIVLLLAKAKLLLQKNTATSLEKIGSPRKTLGRWQPFEMRTNQKRDRQFLRE